MPLYRFEGKEPVIHETAWVHPTAVLIGAVTIEAGCWVAPGAVLRGDWGEISVGPGSNIQDNVVIHARPEDRTALAKDSHVGHGAILHGCALEEHVLVGMGAVINDGAVIGAGCVIGAGAVVPPGMQVPPRKLLIGVPARIQRDLDDNMERFFKMGTALYQTLPERYRGGMEEIPCDERGDG